MRDRSRAEERAVSLARTLLPALLGLAACGGSQASGSVPCAGTAPEGGIVMKNEKVLGPEEIHDVVLAHLAGLRSCYDQGMARKPNLNGGLTMAWKIAANGNVVEATVATSSLDDAIVEQCVVDQVRSWQFPSSSAPSTVNWPFKFGLTH
jgi:hypothetical protein